MADPGLNQSGADRAREQMQDAAEKARLTFRRLSGLDRSGPPPPETLAGQPWRVWTIPNAIGFIRLALIPVFLVLALSSEDGTDIAPLVIFAVIGWTDYLDGITARLTGQYSRFGRAARPARRPPAGHLRRDRVLEVRPAPALGARRCWSCARCS